MGKKIYHIFRIIFIVKAYSRDNIPTFLKAIQNIQASDAV